MYLKHLCCVVLWLWCTANINVHSSTTFPNVVYDWTKPLTALMGQTISYQEFIESLVFLPNGDFLNVSVIYSLDCNITMDCAEKIDEIGSLCERTFNNTLSIDLIISLTINEEDLMFDLDERKILQIRTPKFKTKILANINDSIACNFLEYPAEHMNSILKSVSSFSSTSSIGLGYHQTLIHECGFPIPLSDWFKKGFIVVKYEIGVVESYGLFRKRMNMLNERCLSFLMERWGVPKSSILLYPKPNQDCFGDLCYYQLFIDYIRMWLKDTNNNKGPGLIVEEQNVKEQCTKPKESSLVGYQWYGRSSVSILRTIYQHFNSFLLSYREWVNWNTEMRNNPAKSYINPTPGKELEIIVDIPDSAIKDGSNWLVVENEINVWKAEKWSEGVVLKTLLFHFYDYTTNVERFEFASRMSHRFDIGCSFGERYTELIVTSMVKACKEINGTRYFVIKTLDLREEDVLSENKTFEYEALIKRPLEEMKKLGNSLLTLHPQASITLWFPLKIMMKSNPPSHTTFCNAKFLAINERFEAVLNWAKCSDLKIILKQVISSENKPSWFSPLQPTSWRNEGSDVSPIAESHPYLVLRNYPNNFNNWTIAPCIDATTVRPNVTEIFFQNKTIGVTFDTEQIRQNETLTTDEYKIMIQLVLHRFDLVEIVLPKNYKDFIQACKWIESENKTSGNQKNILLSYVLRETDLDSSHAKFAEFVPFMGHLRKTELTIVKGIHLDLYESLQPFTNHSKLLAVEISLTQLENTGIRIGLLVDTPCCLEFVRLFVSTNSTIHPEIKFLKKIHYLICKQEHAIELMENLNNMDRIFDTHLYLKNAMKEFLPDLNLYFHVDIIDHQRKSKFHSESYMKTVSNLMKFAAAYETNYFFINAFDPNHKDLKLKIKNGWWEIKNYTSLSDPSTYTEKEPEYQDRPFWIPEPLQKHSETDSEIMSHFPVIFALVAVALGLAMGLFYYLRLRKLEQFLSKDEVKEFFNGSSEGSKPTQNQSNPMWKAEYLKFLANFEIDLMDLQMDKQTILGSGNFGTVYKGIAKETLAAIKQPNKNCTKDLFKSVLSEVKLLSYIGEHQNVVGFIGAYAKEIHKGVLYIAMELCKNGSLENFLRQKEHVTTSSVECRTENPYEGDTLFMHDLYNFSHQIACGMEYIEGKNVVHGDLAARNILLDENYTCKIGDFGLSRKLYEYQKYVKKSQDPLPWKWMAYESLTKMEFTSKSDVWSFGVTVWEIFSLGIIPYCTLSWSFDFNKEIEIGLRLSKPKFASDQIYLKLLDCWKLDSEMRPTFTEIASFFKELCNSQYDVLEGN